MGRLGVCSLDNAGCVIFLYRCRRHRIKQGSLSARGWRGTSSHLGQTLCSDDLCLKLSSPAKILILHRHCYTHFGLVVAFDPGISYPGLVDRQSSGLLEASVHLRRCPSGVEHTDAERIPVIAVAQPANQNCISSGNNLWIPSLTLSPRYFPSSVSIVSGSFLYQPHSGTAVTVDLKPVA